MTQVQKGLASIDAIHYSMMSSAQVQKLSTVEVTHGNLYDALSVPVRNGCHDQRMGLQSKSEGNCVTCGESYEVCPGHFGHIGLRVPVFNVGLIRHVQVVMQCICKRCSSLLIPKEQLDKFVAAMRRAKGESLTRSRVRVKAVAFARKTKFCPYCGFPNGAVKKGNAGPISLRVEYPSFTAADEEFMHGAIDPMSVRSGELSAMQVQSLLSRIPELHREAVGICVPDGAVLSNVPVPPVCLRAYVRTGNGFTQEDDLTVELRNMANLNSQLKKGIESGEAVPNITGRYYNIQGHSAMVINSEQASVAAAYMRDKAVRSICSRLKGKEGRFRGNLSGKRVDFTGRTVISPDPNVEVYEVVVPEFMARRLTFPEPVTALNMARMRQLVTNGTSAYPGAVMLRLANGAGSKFLGAVGSRFRKELAANLAVGDLVERHIATGDVVLFNRQPSLHKMSIMAHRAIVMPGKTLRFNEFVCAPYNADFDGDEMNLHVPQTYEARLEAIQLMAVTENIISPKNGEPIIAATQDFLTGTWLLTQRDCFLSRQQMMMLVSQMGKGVESLELPPPTIRKPVELWTGKQVFSMMLRPRHDSPVSVSLAMKERHYKGRAVVQADTGSVKTLDVAFCDHDGYVLISRSELLCGCLGKKTLGGTKPGLFLTLVRTYGSIVAAQVMGRLARVSAKFLTRRGWTIGIDDVAAPANIEAYKAVVAAERYASLASKLTSFFAQEEKRKKDLSGKSSSSSSGFQLLENEVNGELSHIRTAIGDRCEGQLPRLNKPRIMAVCGSKGSALNLSQMMLCVGQQNVSGRRIFDGFEGRSLPHFLRGSLSHGPAARGFVENSFNSGLLPCEFLFHAMGGREGLIDTAVKTSETGYMQRKLMKCLEDYKVCYDMTVRNSRGQLVQLQFGDDGLNPTHMECASRALGKCVGFSDVWSHLSSIVVKSGAASLLVPSASRKVVESSREIAEPSREMVESSREMVESSAGYIDSRNALLVEISRLSGSYPLSSSQTHESSHALESFGDEYLTFLKTKPLPIPLDFLLAFQAECCRKYISAVVQPGHAVGAIAAQSLGEPTTQMTLKTFHFAGVSSMNVTLGVPRIKEIVNGNKTIATPLVTAFLDEGGVSCAGSAVGGVSPPPDSVASFFAKNVSRIVSCIERTTVSDVASSARVVLDSMGSMFVEIQVSSDLLASRGLESATTASIQASIFSKANSSKLRQMKVKATDVLVIDQGKSGGFAVQIKPSTGLVGSSVSATSSFDKQSSHSGSHGSSYASMAWMAMQSLAERFGQIIVGGLSACERVVVAQDVPPTRHGVSSSSKQTAVLIEGTGLREVMSMIGVDGTRTLSNHVCEVEQILGVEAARTVIVQEIKKILSHHGIQVDARHTLLLADCMTNSGAVLGMNRFGLSKTPQSTLMLASFEKTSNHLFDAAMYGARDEVKGVSDCIILGRQINVGTGAFGILDEETSGPVPNQPFYKQQLIKASMQRFTGTNMVPGGGGLGARLSQKDASGSLPPSLIDAARELLVDQSVDAQQDHAEAMFAMDDE